MRASALLSGTRIALIGALWGLAAFAAGAALVAAAPKLVGGQSFSVLSGSMSPAINTGDEVIVLPLAARDIRAGEVVAFNDPGNRARLLNHRVQWVERRGRRISVITMGDANNAPERWSVPVTGRVGRVVARIPYAGYAFGQLSDPVLRVALIAVPAVLLAILILLSIWRSPSPRLGIDGERPEGASGGAL